MEISEKTDLIDKIVSDEKQCHLVFFGKTFDLTDFANTLRKYGEEKIKFWQNLGLEPHFLPKVSMMPSDNYPGWKIKPENWFYQKIAKAKIFRQINGNLKKVETVELEGVSVLIDTRLKPNYDNDSRTWKQTWKEDNLCGPVIEELRKARKIVNYNPQSSRFNISADEWESQIKPVLAERLGLETKQIRLERVIETNVIPQLYHSMPRKDDDKTSTWVWYEEYFENCNFQLSSGFSSFSVRGGLAGINYRRPDQHWHIRSCRPLIVL